MITVVEGVNPLMLIFFCPILFFGLGWSAMILYRPSDFSLRQDIALVILTGMILSYGIVLVFRSLYVSLVLAGVISIFGLFATIYYLLYYDRRLWSNKWLGAAFLCLIYLSPIIAQPLNEWDERSIWFFHAKMIYTAGSIGKEAGWQHESVSFSHPDYPKLIPTMAAYVAFTAGFWNEYIPKMSLFFVILPAFIWLCSFVDRAFSSLVMLLLIPLNFGGFLWIGYMDGFLALYASISVLLLGKYMQSHRFSDLVSVLVCLVFCMYIKNEGLLLAMIGFFVVLFVMHFHKIKITAILKYRRVLFAVIVLLPFAFWEAYKRQWGLENDLQIGTSGFFARIFSRISDGSYKMIFESSFQQIEQSILLFFAICIALFARRKSLPEKSLPALLLASIYYIGMITVYLGTPFDLAYHLGTSVDRTMLPVKGCMFVSSYFILRHIEGEGTDER